ncbi:hypothetical protein MRX96_024431 [Rhipicephalus microplus]
MISRFSKGRKLDVSGAFPLVGTRRQGAHIATCCWKGHRLRRFRAFGGVGFALRCSVIATGFAPIGDWERSRNTKRGCE